MLQILGAIGVMLTIFLIVLLFTIVVDKTFR